MQIEADNLGRKAAKGTMWASIDRFTVMGVTFVVNLIMARILSVSDYGLIGMICIFTTMSNILVDGGFGNALIHKKHPTQTDFSTIFFWNVGLSVAIYGIIYLCAPLIAGFFHQQVLVGVTRMLALVIIFNALIIIQVNRLRKQLAFKTLAIVNISAALIGGISGIIMARCGYGVYSLVWSQIIIGATQFVAIFILGHWLPSPTFSMAAFKDLFGFGGYLLAANLLQVFCNNFQNVIIGRRFSATQLGLYSQAQKIDQIVSFQIPQILVQVMFPVYSSLQDDDDRLRNMLAMNMRVVAFAMFPIFTLLILLAEPTFTLLYGARWLGSAPYFQILCCGGFFVALQNINFYAVAAKGKSRTLFNWSFYKWGMLLLLMFAGMHFGIYGLLCGLALSNFNIFMVNAALASKFVGFKIRTQWGILAPIFLLAGVSAAITMAAVRLTGINVWFMLPIYAATYLLLGYACRLRAIGDAIAAIRQLRK